MVTDRNAEELPCPDEPSRYLQVLFTRLGAAGRMVVADEQSSGVGQDRALEDLARMHFDVGDPALGNFLDAKDAILRIKMDCVEALAVGLCRRTQDTAGIFGSAKLSTRFLWPGDANTNRLARCHRPALHGATKPVGRELDLRNTYVSEPAALHDREQE